MGRLFDIQTALKLFMKILGLAESFKTMNRPDHDALWRLISRKVWKIETWNFDTIFIPIFNLCYQNLKSISLIVQKLCAFGNVAISVILSSVHHNFRLELKLGILKVSSERSSSDLSGYILFQMKKYIFLIYKKIF